MQFSIGMKVKVIGVTEGMAGITSTDPAVLELAQLSSKSQQASVRDYGLKIGSTGVVTAQYWYEYIGLEFYTVAFTERGRKFDFDIVGGNLTAADQ